MVLPTVGKVVSHPVTINKILCRHTHRSILSKQSGDCKLQKINNETITAVFRRGCSYSGCILLQCQACGDVRCITTTLLYMTLYWVRIFQHPESWKVRWGRLNPCSISSKQPRPIFVKGPYHLKIAGCRSEHGHYKVPVQHSRYMENS